MTRKSTSAFAHAMAMAMIMGMGSNSGLDAASYRPLRRRRTNESPTEKRDREAAERKIELAEKQGDQTAIQKAAEKRKRKEEKKQQDRLRSLKGKDAN